MPSALIWTIAAIAGVLLVVLARWQQYTQTLPSGLDFHPVAASEPEPDTATQTLLNLGFDSPLDYWIAAERGQLRHSSGRLLYHPEHRCFAQLASAHCTLSSFLTDAWTLRASNRAATLLEQLSQPGQLVWHRYPTTPLDQLLVRHLEDRARLCEAKGVEPIAAPTVDLLWTKAKEEALRRKQVVKRQNPALSFVKGVGFWLRSRKS